MKNIHILPTKKPIRLFEDDLQLYYSKDKNRIGNIISNKHIYITSDEEIKEGWILVNGFILRQVDYIDGYMVIDITGGKHHNFVCKKIILTTDQDLIKDGVQAIDDEFLELFVKNPSCESVEVENERVVLDDVNYNFDVVEYNYKIIIPKEEAKKGLNPLELFFQSSSDACNLECLEQEELENRFAEWWKNNQLKVYSEEEVEDIMAETWIQCVSNDGNDFKVAKDKILQQFKKK
jgi:hypothetical protein